LPGIPYDEKSSKRLLGDIPEFEALERAGQSPKDFWKNLARKKNSAIVQYFGLPFMKPFVAIADFRESQDLMLRRGKDLGRGWLNNTAWSGVIPEHFIAMEEHDPRYKATKSLSKDLMTPTLLHEVSPDSWLYTIKDDNI
jgi:hypothetical protein